MRAGEREREKGRDRPAGGPGNLACGGRGGCSDSGFIPSKCMKLKDACSLEEKL